MELDVPSQPLDLVWSVLDAHAYLGCDGVGSWYPVILKDMYTLSSRGVKLGIHVGSNGKLTQVHAS